MISNRFIYIGVFVMLGLYFRSQTAPAWQSASREEVVLAYKNACSWFINTPNYSFDIKYSSYKNHNGSELTEITSGYYKRSGKNYVSDAVGIKTIQNDRLRMIIDTSEKTIAISDPGTLSPSIQSSEELNKLLENVKSLRKRVVNKNLTYRIDFRKNEIYEAYEFSVSEKGRLEKLVYYYSEQTEKDYDDNNRPVETKIKPRLDILFFNYLVSSKTNESEFNDNSIVLAANSRVSLINKYKNYTLKDYRVQGKK